MFIAAIKPQVDIAFNPQLLQASIVLVKNQPMSHIGHKIKAAIEAKGITQAALAEAVGVSNNAVTKWVQSGKVAKKNIPTVAKELGMSVFDFLDNAQNEDMAHMLYILNDPKLRALLFAAEKLPEYKKDLLLQTSTALAEQPKQGNGDKQ